MFIQDLRRGEYVLVEHAGRKADAQVVLVSANGASLMLTFDAMLGGYMGMMPVLWSKEQGAYIDLIKNEQVGITRQ
jgi:hypothetical protein